MLRAMKYFSLVIVFVWIGCGIGESKSDYGENVEITVRMGRSEDTSSKVIDDLLYTITNRGDKTVTFCGGTVEFYDSSNKKMAASRIGTIWVNASKEIAEIFFEVEDSKKIKYRPLGPGESIEGGDAIWFLFNYDDKLMEKLTSRWDELRAEAVITKLEIQ